MTKRMKLAIAAALISLFGLVSMAAAPGACAMHLQGKNACAIK